MSSPWYNFGALPPLPEGYAVCWLEEVEHYVAVGPDDWQSVITWNPHQARKWCFAHALEMAKLDTEGEAAK